MTWMCPLCGVVTDHPRCRFAAGNLACVNEPCGNPHHRKAEQARVRRVTAAARSRARQRGGR